MVAELAVFQEPFSALMVPVFNFCLAKHGNKRMSIFLLMAWQIQSGLITFGHTGKL